MNNSISKMLKNSPKGVLPVDEDDDIDVDNNSRNFDKYRYDSDYDQTDNTDEEESDLDYESEDDSDIEINGNNKSYYNSDSDIEIDVPNKDNIRYENHHRKMGQSRESKIPEIDLNTLMKQNFAYPDASDPDLMFKLFQKREFYANRIPEAPDINDYNDIKEHRDNICARNFTLHKHQAMLANYINPDTPYRGVLLFHGVGTGKCIEKNFLTYCNGILTKMENIWNENHSTEIIKDAENVNEEWSEPNKELIVNSIDENGKIVQKNVKRLYREKVDTELCKITLENGYKLEKTQIHQLNGIEGWTNELKVGDYIAIPKKVYNCPNKNNLLVAPSLAYVVGWMISEGCERCKGQTSRITQNDISILEKIKKEAINVGIIYNLNMNTMPIHPDSRNSNILNINSIDFTNFLKINGYDYGNKSATKIIPEFIMNAPISCIKLFLRAYFDAEANMNERDGVIEMSSASELIIKQLDMLCRMFSINMRLKEKMKCATNTEKKIKRQYYIGLISGKSLRIFKSEIGFDVQYKKTILNKICDTRKINTNIEVIPITDKLQKIYEETKLPKRRFIDFSYIKPDKKTGRIQLPTIATLKKTVQNLQDVLVDKDLLEDYKLCGDDKQAFIKESINKLQKEIDREVYWIKIESIEYVKYNDYVYDLEIDEIHNYVGGGILCHNTCAGVAIAEKFKGMVQKYNTKIYILVSGPLIKENWKSHLLKCTGETYLKYQDQTVYIDDAEKAKNQKNAMNNALQYYRFMSYRSFYKRVLGEKIVERKTTKDAKTRVSYRKTDEGEFERDIAVDRIYNLNNTIILIDEAHNLTGNAYGDALMQIINNSSNLRIVLLTATPMKNLADDIVPLLNFIRPQTSPIERDKIFNSVKNHEMEFKEGGIEYFKNMAKGYISHVRGADPLIFAKRVDKGVKPDELIFTKLVRCKMLKFQRKIYDNAVREKDDTLDRRSEAVANFVFPGLSQDRKTIEGYYGREGVNIVKNQLKQNHDLLNRKIATDILGTTENINDLIYISDDGRTITGKILKLENLKLFSVKFYKALKKISRLVWGKKGPRVAFVYSNLVKVGIELFQQILLQNGYLEYQDKATYQILPNTICYFCGKTYKDHTNLTRTTITPPSRSKQETDTEIENEYINEDSDTDNEESDNEESPEANNEFEAHDISASSTDYDGYRLPPKGSEIPEHKFYPATFISVTGKSSEESMEFIPEDKKQILDNVFNSIENKEGKFIKLVLGSKVMNEGLSLANVAEVHILDVYFNLGKVDQVVGRAIRQCSHYKLMNEDNKFPFVNVYKYVVTLENHLSTEEELYQKAEQKYLLIKKVERAMKEVAIDCPLNVYGNMFKEEIKQYKDCGEPGKQPCPTICDYQKCDYKCDDNKLNLEFYDPDRKIYKKISKNKLDYSTFTHALARNEIENAKKKIKELYLKKYEYTLESIIDYVKNSFDEDDRELFDEFFVYKALDELIPITENDFISFKDTIIDKYNRQGYLIYAGSQYIFQPLDQNEDVPMYYRTTFDKPISQKLSLYNYLKNTIKYQEYKGIKNKNKEEGNAVLRDEALAYNFEATMDYYDNRDEFKYVGIIDKELSRRKSKQADEIKDVFKIREKRAKILEKKRGTGIPSLKGAVCSTSKDKAYLEAIAKDLGLTMKGDLTRADICDNIKDRMLLLEKYGTSKEKNKLTYIMIPSNHELRFPRNSEDYIDLIKNKISDEIKFKLDITITSEKKKTGPEKGYPTYFINIKDDAKLNDYADFLTKLGAKKENKMWIITVD